MTKLNLGCGFVTPENWINVDYGFGARFMKNGLFRLANRSLRIFDANWNKTIQVHNLESTFPWDDESIDIIYASHILEHFTKDSGSAFLKECCRVLKKDGIIRILVPDLESIIQSYNSGDISADEFLGKCGVQNVAPGFCFTNYYRNIFGNHKCMYDTKSLVRILHQLGFETTPKNPFESRIDDIHAIELESRTISAAIIEGTKR